MVARSAWARYLGKRRLRPHFHSEPTDLGCRPYWWHIQLTQLKTVREPAYVVPLSRSPRRRERCFGLLESQECGELLRLHVLWIKIRLVA